MIKVITATYPFLELFFSAPKSGHFFANRTHLRLSFMHFFYIFSPQNIDSQSFLVYSITIAK